MSCQKVGELSVNYSIIRRIFPLQISNPTSHKPPLKFGTMPYSYTQMTLQKYFPEMYSYMKKYNRFNTTAKAVKAVKDG